MKENRYYKDRDIRAVENPYEASFDLADTMMDLFRSLKMNLEVLIIIFLYYMAVIIGILIFNILYGTNYQLNLVSVVISFLMMGITIITIKWLLESHTFLRDIGFNQKLMLKIRSGVEKGNFDIRGRKELDVKDEPIKGLMNLIKSTSQYSRNIARTFKIIIAFISVWYVAGILYLSIQTYRYGLDIEQWKFDWLLPGGIDTTVAVLATLIIVLVKAKFDFIKKRYDAIENALASAFLDIPKAQDPIRRYSEYLTSQKGYVDLKPIALWNKGQYFDAELDTNQGKILVKLLKNTPRTSDLKKFREMVTTKSGDHQLDRAVIIFKEDPNTPLSDQVYEDIVDNPIIIGHDVCNIQLVMEGEDGKYDFIPFISF